MVLFGDVYRISLLVVCGIVVCTAGWRMGSDSLRILGLHEKGKRRICYKDTGVAFNQEMLLGSRMNLNK